MLLGIHITSDEAQALRARLTENPWLPRLRKIVEAYLFRENVFTQARPLAPRSAELTWQLMSPLSHIAASLSLYHAIEPTPVVEAALRNFLLWTLEQKVMLVHGAFLQGLYLRGVILSLDAVGETLSKEQRAAILEHLILTAVDNPDTNDPVNNRPDKNAPIRRVMEMPGTGFHLKDENVNNWDLLGSMGLLYVARATDALLPNRAADVNTWIDVARRRVERFFRLQYTNEGEYGEGPSYYSYATQGAVSTLDMLHRWPRGAWWKELPLKGLMASARWAREVQPREVVHGPFNYNDCSLDAYEAPTVIHWIAAQAKDSVAQNYGDELMKLSLDRIEYNPGKSMVEQEIDKAMWSLIWRDDRLENKPPRGSGSRWFGRLGTVISRSGYTSDGICLCFRCGDLAGAHTHADRGNFLLSAFGENIVAEGGKPYDRSIPEYNSYHRETLAHNVAMPKGRPQVRNVGERPCNGRITDFKPLPDGLFLRADISDVYPDSGRVERTLRFSHRGWLLVQDFIEKPGEAIDFLLHTDNLDRKAMFEIENDRVIIKRPNATLIVLPLLPSTIIDDGTHFQDSDREGLRSLILRRADQRMATLLVVVRAGGESKVELQVAGKHRWNLVIDKRSETIALDKE